MDYKKKLMALLVTISPYIKEIVQNTIIPWCKKMYYKRTEASIKKMVLKLAELGEKTLTCTDKKKKARHIIGFKLGYVFVCAIEPILAEAKNVLGEINAKINGEELIGDEEVPF